MDKGVKMNEVAALLAIGIFVGLLVLVIVSRIADVVLGILITLFGVAGNVSLSSYASYGEQLEFYLEYGIRLKDVTLWIIIVGAILLVIGIVRCCLHKEKPVMVAYNPWMMPYPPQPPYNMNGYFPPQPQMNYQGTICPACGATSTGKFCTTCGASLSNSSGSSGTIYCTNCGKELEANDKFCTSCGTSTTKNF